MNHFIALSFPRDFNDQKRDEIQFRATQALSAFHDGPVTVVEQSQDHTLLCHASLMHGFIRKNQNRYMLSCCRVVIDEKSSRPLSEMEIANAWFAPGSTGINRFAAPFVICGRRHSGEGFHALSDRYGLAHLFGWQGNGICAISSSALVIGKTFSLEPDRDAIGEFGLLGHYLGSATAVQGVRKSKPGTIMEMAWGCLSVSVAYDRKEMDPIDVAECVDHGVTALREAVVTHVEAFPECEIELSGGIDSRLLLAAIPKAQRHRHTAVTLSSAGSPDARIARTLAESSGMQHRIIDLDMASEIPAHDLVERLGAASFRHDHAGNPVDKLALEIVRSDLGIAPRLSGQNGEIARGFYYHGQPLEGGFDNKRHARLINWRLKGNDSVRQSILNEEFKDRATASLVRNTRSTLQTHNSWPIALDRLYLDERMQRWCGCAISAAYADRAILMPFFHSAFVQWALAAPAREKLGSRLACKLMEAMDPELAAMPLDTGITPSQLSSAGPGNKIRGVMTLGSKAVNRVLRRVTGRRRHNIGTKSLTLRLLDSNVLSILDWDALRDSDIFDDAVLDGIEIGLIPLDRPTLGFLISTSFTLSCLRNTRAGHDGKGTNPVFQ